MTFVLVPLMLGVVVLLATYLPARGRRDATRLRRSGASELVSDGAR